MYGALPLHGNAVVAAGGVLTVQGDVDIANDGTLTVAGDGAVNLPNSRLFLYGPMTNSGTLNVTSSSSGTSEILIYNNGMASNQGSLFNLAGGTINLNGAQPSTISSQTSPDECALINRGTIVASGSGFGSTHSIHAAGFDNTSGVVTNLYGTLSLSTFTNMLSGIFYAANGATIQFNGGTARRR